MIHAGRTTNFHRDIRLKKTVWIQPQHMDWYSELHTNLSVIYRLALLDISLDEKLHRSGRSPFRPTAARVIRAMESFKRPNTDPHATKPLGGEDSSVAVIVSTNP